MSETSIIRTAVRIAKAVVTNRSQRPADAILPGGTAERKGKPVVAAENRPPQAAPGASPPLGGVASRRDGAVHLVERFPNQAMAMSSERIIKKYPNRRLYDTEVSRYITLADVRSLVMGSTRFRVVDAANDADITRSILLQIMLEEETGGEPLFSAAMLAQIIRFYGGTVQGVFARYLESSLELFAQQQKQLTDAWGDSPLDAVTRMTKRNMDLWSELQDEFMRAAGIPVGGERPGDDDDQ